MKTQRKVTANVDQLQFGYWDMEIEEFVPIDAQYVDQVQKAITELGCTEGLLDALAMFAANIVEMIGDDLRDIWARLDNIEKK